MTMIVPLLVTEITAHLVRICITNVPEGDPTRAAVVKAGRFQDDRVLENVHVAISGGDPDDPTYKDGAITLEDMHKIGYRYPVGELSGTRFWWRRGIIQIGCYFIKEQFPEEIAMQHAYTVLARVQSNLENIRVIRLTDDFGEQALQLFSYGNTFSESGGPPSNYIWRGKVYWTCLTVRQ